jgi:hypothetical protein
MTPHSVRFTFSPALYPQTPFVNHSVFLHGEIVEIKTRQNEQIVRAKDEKGEWNAYAESTIALFEKGNLVRAYGIIVSQPDGNTMLAAKWIKKIEKEEYEYCQRETGVEWEKMEKENPSLKGLKPFVPKKNIEKNPPTQAENTSKVHPETDSDFIPAAQLKIEREYL